MNDRDLEVEQEYLDRTIEFIERELDRLSRPPTWSVPYRDTAKALLAVEGQRRADLEQARPRPYFGRVDFTFSGGRSIEAYIGIVGVADSNTKYVYDWRAPFPGQVYYADPSAEVSYEAPGGVVSGTITRKRQYAIEEARLIEVTEVYRRYLTDGQPEHVEDRAGVTLQEQLEAGRGGELQQAVATLRPDQYQQVAGGRQQVMLIQGVAGSGKSIVGLHRIAYLLSPLNTGPDRISTDRVLFFGPSRGYLRYVANLLPSIDVHGVQHTTVLDWMLGLLTARIYLDRREPLLEKLLRDRSDSWEAAGRAARLKGSISMVRALDRHVRDLQRAFTAQARPLSVAFGGGTTITLEAPQVLRVMNGGDGPLNTQREKAVDRLSESLAAEFRRSDDRDATNIPTHEIVAMIRGEVEQQVSAFWPRLDFRREYRFLLSEPNRLHFPSASSLEQADVDALGESLPKGQTVFSPEDVGPLCYLDHLLNDRSNQGLQHVVIDEAQEVSVTELSVIRMHGQDAGFTILGDLTQHLAPQGINRWREVLQLFRGLSISRHEVRVSYRSTYEITRYANRLLKKADRNAVTAIPFRRHGEPPQVHGARSYEAMVDSIASQVAASETAGTVGVLCKTTSDARRLYRALRGQGMDLGILTRDETPTQRIVVAPIHMTRGLEYDTVILAGVSRDNFPDTALHTKLLYVGASRAVHFLHVNWVGQPATQLGIRILPRAPKI